MLGLDVPRDLGIGFHEVSIDEVTRDRGLLDFLNVCYVLSRRPLTEFTPVAQVGNVSVYRNDRTFPRAFAVGRVRAAEIGRMVAARGDWARAWDRVQAASTELAWTALPKAAAS